MMETMAKLMGARISAQKARLVADQIRGKPVEEALNLLAFSTKKAAGLVRKVLNSAIANAEHNEGADVDELRVSRICVDEGTAMRPLCGIGMLTVLGGGASLGRTVTAGGSGLRSVTLVRLVPPAVRVAAPG